MYIGRDGERAERASEWEELRMRERSERVRAFASVVLRFHRSGALDPPSLLLCLLQLCLRRLCNERIRQRELLDSGEGSHDPALPSEDRSFD